MQAPWYPVLLVTELISRGRKDCHIENGKALSAETGLPKISWYTKESQT